MEAGEEMYREGAFKEAYWEVFNKLGEIVREIQEGGLVLTNSVLGWDDAIEDLRCVAHSTEQVRVVCETAEIGEELVELGLRIRYLDFLILG